MCIFSGVFLMKCSNQIITNIKFFNLLQTDIFDCLDPFSSVVIIAHTVETEATPWNPQQRSLMPDQWNQRSNNNNVTNFLPWSLRQSCQSLRQCPCRSDTWQDQTCLWRFTSSKWKQKQQCMKQHQVLTKNVMRPNKLGALKACFPHIPPAVCTSLFWMCPLDTLCLLQDFREITDKWFANNNKLAYNWCALATIILSIANIK